MSRGAMEESRRLDVLARRLIGLSVRDETNTMLLTSGFVPALSGVVAAIPVAATLTPVVRNLASQGSSADPVGWARTLSSILGVGSTPVGFISRLTAVGSLEKERGVKVDWDEFLEVGCAVLATQRILVVGFIYFIYASARFDLFSRSMSPPQAPAGGPSRPCEGDSMGFSGWNDGVGQLERALSGEEVEIESPSPSALPLALDGSNQDRTCIALAGELARPLEVRVLVPSGVEGEVSDEVRHLVDRTSRAFGRVQNVALGSRPPVLVVRR